jgi:hypothetical protein
MTTRHQSCTRVQVEQAVARGDSIDQIYERLGVEPMFLDAVLQGMDAANRHDDNAAELVQRPVAQRRTVQAHGTHAAFNRHKVHHEQPCDACEAGERRHRAERHQRTLQAGVPVQMRQEAS